MSTAVAAYLMNPAEDVIVFGDELAEGMWVLPEAAWVRSGRGDGEDSAIRAQRFRKVTRLRITPAAGATPAQTVFVGEWIDGYQEVHSYAVIHGWIVKKAAS
jgi:hypothetical protein